MISQPLSAFPPPIGPRLERTRDQLKLLAIFHYVMGGLTCLFGLFPIIHVLIGGGLVYTSIISPSALTSSPGVPTPTPGTPPYPPMTSTTPSAVPFGVMGAIFMIAGAVAMLFMQGLGILTIYSGISLANQNRYMLSMVMAGFQCMSFPLGTMLGVFTFVVLGSQEARILYGRS